MTDPQGTRRRIFEAAVDEFAARGSAGARVDRIATAASANKESIYRYFGTKDQLLRRVLDRYLDERGEQLLPRSQDLDSYTAGLFAYHLENPEFLRLSLWEALEFGGEPDGGTVEHRRRHYQEKVGSVAEQQKNGNIDPDLDPRHLIVALCALAAFWHTLPQVVRLVFGGEPDEETIVAHQKFLAECVRRIVTPPAGPAPE